MSDRSNLAIGAGMGSALGGASGLLVASKQFKANLPEYEKTFFATKLKDQGVDLSGKSAEVVADCFNKAKSDFGKEFSEFVPQLKNALRKHWILPLAAAGLAIGTATAAIVNKVKASKAEKLKPSKN